jgi:hypothetical protein
MDEATLAVVGSIAAALWVLLWARRSTSGRPGRSRIAARGERQGPAGASARGGPAGVHRTPSSAKGGRRHARAGNVRFGVGPPGTAWATHGVLLAGALSEAEYDPVASACGKLALWFGVNAPDLLPGTNLSVVPEAERVLGDLSKEIVAAIGVLHPIGYPESASAAPTDP